jgi:excisionase family DNA binding protein
MNLRTLTLAEAHAATGIPVKSLRRLVVSGKLSGVRVGKNWRVTEASLIAFVQHTPQVEPVKTNDRHFADIVPEDRFA